MKKTFRTLVSVLLLVCMLASMQMFTASAAEPTPVSVYDGKEDPLEAPVGKVYTIDSAAEFYAFQKLVAETSTKKDMDVFSGYTFELTTDIVLNEGDASTWSIENAPEYTWTPIGSDGKGSARWARFAGIFDGKGHTISGVYMVSDELDTAGLFSNIGGCTITNFVLTNSFMATNTKATSATNSCRLGFVAGANVNASAMTYITDVTVSNCYSECIFIDGAKSRNYVSGIIARSHKDIEITGCKVIGCEIESDTHAGGIVGYSQATATIKDCMVIDTTITGDKPDSDICLGGIIGRMDSTTKTDVDNCYADCTLVKIDKKSEKVSNSLAAIIGFVKTGKTTTISDCIGIVEIEMTATSDRAAALVGGVAKDNGNGLTITNCIADCDETYGLYIAEEATKSNLARVEMPAKPSNDALVQGDADLSGAFFVTPDGEYEVMSKWDKYAPADSAPLSAKLYGYQRTTVTSGEFDVRIIGLIDEASSIKYWGLGLDITVMDANGKIIESSYNNVHAAYSSIKAGGVTKEAASVDGANADSAFFLKDFTLEADQGNVTVVVKTYTINNQRVKTYTDIACFTVNTNI